MPYISTYRGIIALLILLIFGGQGNSYAQTISITDSIINVYQAVTNIDADNCTLTVASNSDFAVNERVLIIQMQGATINETNSPDFGNIIDIGSTGNYEINYVCEVIGSNQLKLVNSLSRTYDVAGKVQIVGIPQQYSGTNINVNTKLTCKSWDGSTGGILFLESSNNISLNANVDVSGKGFRGGLHQDIYPWWGGCNNSGYTYSASDYRGSFKGEGVALLIVGKESGKAKQANGGGGGNNHNSGGGGGGNYNAGGSGGERQNGSACAGEHPGIGGVSLNSSYPIKIFLGGGGGAGHDNNEQGSNGGNGGGIVILNTNLLTGNNYTIKADGENAYYSLSDGAGGGGGAGVVFVKANSYSSTSINFTAIGGNGGNSSKFDTQCMGPGGGGSGGAIMFSGNSIPNNININHSGGQNGIVDLTTTDTTCEGTAGGAQPGQNGDTILSATLVESIASCTNCLAPLPVEWLSFTATAKDRQVHLVWRVGVEENVSHYEVERSVNGRDFKTIASVTANKSKVYKALDAEPAAGTNYYRVKNLDFNGESSYSQLQMISIEDIITSLNIYPNPAAEGAIINIDAFASSSDVSDIYILNTVGQLIHDQNIHLEKGKNLLQIQLPQLTMGIYFVQLKTATGVRTERLIISE